MNNLLQRSLTGIVLMVISILAISYNQLTFMLFAGLINLLGLLEFYRLFHSSAIIPRKWAGTFLSVVLFITSALFVTSDFGWKIMLLNIPIAFFIFVLELYLRSESPFQNLAFTFMGILYVTVPAVFLYAMAFVVNKNGLYSPKPVLGFFYMVWASDIGAYAAGKLFGKHPLFKRISPGKTWEGSIGGTCCVLLTAYIVSRFYDDLKLPEWMIVAIIVVVIGTLGDLVKSMMKRSLHIKDSGKILPGHGGILDRCDALFSASLFVFCYLALI